MEKELALIIKEQLIGTYSGHMAAIPFNPVLNSIFGVLMNENRTFDDNRDLAAVLRRIADALEGSKQ